MRGGEESRLPVVAASTTFLLAAHEVPTTLPVAPATTLASTQGPDRATSTAAVVGQGGAPTARRRSHWLVRYVGGRADYLSRELVFPHHRSVNAPHSFGHPHPSLVAATPAPHLDRRLTHTTCIRRAVAKWTTMSNQGVLAKMAVPHRRPLTPSPTSGRLLAEGTVHCRRCSPGFLHTWSWPPPPCCGGFR